MIAARRHPLKTPFMSGGRIDGVRIEAADLAELVAIRRNVFVAVAEVQGQLVGDTPVVLDVAGVVALKQRHERRGLMAPPIGDTEQERGESVAGIGGGDGRVWPARLSAVEDELAAGIAGEKRVQLHALEIRAGFDLVPSVNPGDLINPVPGVLRIQAGARATALSRAEAGHFRRIERGDRKAAAGVILVHVDFGKLLVCDNVRQASGESQLGHVEARACRHGGVLQARVSNAKLTQKIRREIGREGDSSVSCRVGAYGCPGKRLVDQTQRIALVLRAGKVAEDTVLLADVVIEPREPAVDVIYVLPGLQDSCSPGRNTWPVMLGSGIILHHVGRNRMDAVGGNRCCRERRRGYRSRARQDSARVVNGS